MNNPTSPVYVNHRSRDLAILAVAALAALAWGYWSAFEAMADRWARDPEYSHGYLVPLFALGILWHRRAMLDVNKIQPSWWGLPLLAIGVTMRYIGARYFYEWIDYISLIPTLYGLGLLLGGWHAFRWFWPSAGFMVFMIPLPYTLEVLLREPLRRLGTVTSTYIMQTCGLPAFSEGMVIVVNDQRIGVVEACSGLRMLMIFFALSTAVALLCERRWWEKAIIVVSAVPIALISNIARITVTGTLYGFNLNEAAKLVFHDLAGWLMMPMGLALLWAELWFLSQLIVVEEDRPMAVGLQLSPPPSPLKSTSGAPAMPSR